MYKAVPLRPLETGQGWGAALTGCLRHLQPEPFQAPTAASSQACLKADSPCLTHLSWVMAASPLSWPLSYFSAWPWH